MIFRIAPSEFSAEIPWMCLEWREDKISLIWTSIQNIPIFHIFRHFIESISISLSLSLPSDILKVKKYFGKRVTVHSTNNLLIQLWKEFRESPHFLFIMLA